MSGQSRAAWIDATRMRVSTEVMIVGRTGSAAACRRFAGSVAVSAVFILLIGCRGSGSPNTYSVDASVSGLSGSGLVLQINSGNDLAVKTNTSYTFADSLASGSGYQVTIKSQPAFPQQTCIVSNGSGTIGASNVTISVSCTTVTHSVGVTVSGLSGTGLVLQLNGGNDLLITTNGAANFPAAIDSGANYAVNVSSPPTRPRQTCSVDNGSGTVGTADISGIVVTCVTVVTTLYSFTDPNPSGSLVQGADGNLYGTTSSTVFLITLSGDETRLFSLGSLGAGKSMGGLILASNGNFYGITQGAPNLSSAVYSVTPGGTGTLITSFGGADYNDFPGNSAAIQGSDGRLYVIAAGEGVPLTQLIGLSLTGILEVAADFPDGLGVGLVAAPLFQARDGMIYGVTVDGGSHNKGRVFTFNPASATPLMKVYSFGATAADASGPGFALIEGKDGNLYGATAVGGGPSATCPSGCGTVFRVTPTGVETVLYSFGTSAADGQSPSGALVLGSDGNFYGMTSAGGSANSNCRLQSGCGTVYRITPAGVETVLYSFGSKASDGVGPSGALVQASDGNLYGTTAAGGATNDGTFLKLDMAGN